MLSGILLLAGFAGMSAQNVVSGKVIDNEGNAIPGAKIEVVGSTESTITELDGTFRLETQRPAGKVKAFYVGMQTKVQAVKPDMLIKLRPDDAHISWSVNAGFGGANITGDEMDDCSLKPTFKVGIGVEMPLGRNWLLMSSLEYKLKGCKWNEEGSGYSLKDNISLHYLQLPVMGAYRLNFRDDMNLTFKAGLYVAYGFKGKMKTTETYDGVTEKSSIDLFKDEEGETAELRRFDSGVITGIDFGYKRFVVGLEADFGFINLLKYDDEDSSIHNGTLFFSVGYRF